MQAFSSTTNVVYIFFNIEKFPRNKDNMEYTPPPKNPQIKPIVLTHTTWSLTI